MIETCIQIQSGMAASPDTETSEMTERDSETHRNNLGAFVRANGGHRGIEGKQLSREEQEAFEQAYLEHRIKEQVEAAIQGTKQEGRLVEILYDTYDFASGLVACRWADPHK